MGRLPDTHTGARRANRSHSRRLRLLRHCVLTMLAVCGDSLPVPTESTCWHCGGVGRCGCTACWRRFAGIAGTVAACVVCRGSGTIVERVE